MSILQFLSTTASQLRLRRERKLSLTKQNLRKETRLMFLRDFRMLIALRMITVGEPEPRADLITSVGDDHNQEGVSCQTTESIRNLGD